MIREGIAAKVREALCSIDTSLSHVAVEVQDTKSPEHGDYATNVALTLAKSLGKNPRDVASQLVKALESDQDFMNVEVAGPGFINFRLQPEAMSKQIRTIIADGPKFGTTKPAEKPPRVNLEFVSVNPNGPITVGSGRGAAFGDTLARVMTATQVELTKEFYINDGVNSEQMRLFAESVRHYYYTHLKRESAFPESGYKGDYVSEIADVLLAKYGETAGDKDVEWFQRESQELMIERHRADLEAFGVTFDIWFSEQSLHDGGQVQQCLEKLKADGNAVERDGALWLESTKFGDDKDRVLVREDGRPTYIASDVAYHEDKFERGAERLIDVWGPDHHGYIARMSAAIQALGHPKDSFEAIIFQIVRFVRDGEAVPMRKRDGNIYSLRDLIDELGKNIAPDADKDEQTRIGRDVARFFYLMRSFETHMDFDIGLATKQTDENPVFYVQYAHARICSIIRKANDEGLKYKNLDEVDFGKLVHDRELSLIKKLCDFPNEVARCAQDYGVHRLATYAVELARTFHHFYDACHVLQSDDVPLTHARLALCEATRIGLANVLDLLGVSAPMRMDRASRNNSAADFAL